MMTEDDMRRIRPFRDVSECLPPVTVGSEKFRAVSLLTGETIAVGSDHSRVEAAGEMLVGVGGFRVERVE